MPTAPKPSMQFVVRCPRYPQFAFNVPALRKLFDKRGEQNRSALIHFVDGVLDTAAQGWDDQEASLIKAQLARTQLPQIELRFGEDDPTVNVTAAPLPTEGATA